jgi:hypothetical protein
LHLAVLSQIYVSYLVPNGEKSSLNLFTGNGKDAGKLSGRIVDSDMHDVARFLNRLLGLAPDIQNR